MQLPKSHTLQNGKYEIISTLGQGGFGITYKAQMAADVGGALGTKKIKVQVAIKEFFFKDYCSRDTVTQIVAIASTTGRDMFQRFKEKLIKEAHILSSFQDAHIVKVFDVFEENGTAYIVMEFIEGESLQTKLQREGILTYDRTMSYMRNLLEAINTIHGRKILHLDIKPSNILINTEDEAILIDFGISKRYDQQQVETSTTPVSYSKGYAPYEQYISEGVKTFSPETDLYSMGATLYRCLTGEVPIESLARLEKEVTLPSSLNTSISKNIELVIMKSMRMSKEDRFHSAQEFQEALSVSNNLTNSVNDTSVKTADQLFEIMNGKEENLQLEKTPGRPNYTEYPGKTEQFPVYVSPPVRSIVTIEESGMKPPAQTVKREAPVNTPKPSNAGNADKTLSVSKENDSPKLSLDSKFNQPVLNSEKKEYPILKKIQESIIEEMILVEGGSFERYSDEYHSCTISIKSFLIGKYSVTQEFWEAIMGKNPSHFSGCEQCPVENVSWNDVQQFILKLKKGTGKNYRLPTESEWEFAAKGGNGEYSKKYAGSDNIEEVGWYDGNSDQRTHPVGQKKPNELGIYDMSGNVWEWCSDWFCQDTFTKMSYQSNPEGPLKGLYRVRKGGSWKLVPFNCLITNRSYDLPNHGDWSIGFRLALDYEHENKKGFYR